MKILIVGAGISGLTLAWNLRKAGHEVVVYEKENEAGGIARGFKKENWQDSVEFFYHHWFTKDKDLLGLMDELGIRKRVVFRKPTTVMYDQGKFYPFDSIPAAIMYPGLGFGISKIRFGLVGIYLRLTRNWREMEKYTAREWMCKYAGEFAYRSMWEPMMIGKFGEAYAEQVNMAWLWARIYSRTISLGTFEGGMQAFFDLFYAREQEKGINFHFGKTITKINKEPDGKFRIILAQGSEEQEFDKVIVTTSPRSMLELSDQLPQAYRVQLESLKHIGALVMCLSLRQPLSPQKYYWYNLPKNEGYPFLALVEHTNFVPSSHYGGETIIYAGDYLEAGHPYFAMSEEELLQQLIPGFKKINPAFSEDWIISFQKFATNYAQPIPFVNQSQRIPALQTPVDGLFFISMSQVYPWDRGMNFAVRLANDLSRAVLA